MPLIELDLIGGIRAIQGGRQPTEPKVFPSKEAADAYRVVKGWLGRPMTREQARLVFLKHWPHLPWRDMQYWAMVKTAAKLIRESV